jgi:hypothetical protein
MLAPAHNTERAGIGAVRVANLDHREIVSFGRETVGRDRHGRRRDHPSEHLVPEKRTRSQVAVHLRNGSRGGDDPRPKPFCQQSGGEPLLAVTMSDKDVSKLPAFSGDPIRQAHAPGRP